MRTLLLCLAVLSIPALAVARPGNEHVKATVSGPAAVASGKAFLVAVTLTIDPGWHVQANTVKDPYIPTRLSVKAPTGFRAGQPAYPVSKRMTMAGEKMEVFTGSVPIKVLVTAPAQAKGKQVLNLEVDYQVCNDQSCLPPASVKLAHSVTVAPADKKAAK